MRTIVVTFMLLAALLSARTLGAQPVVAAGTRVRVWLPDSVMPAGPDDQAGTRRGIVDRMDATVLRLRVGSDTRNVPTMVVSRLDVSEGTPRHRVAGAVVGGLLSGGAFVGMACGFSNGSCAVNANNVGGFLAYYAVGAIPGVLIGRAVGGRLHGDERWRAVWHRE